MANWCSQGSGGGTGVSPRTRGGAGGSVPERRDVYERLADELRRINARCQGGGLVADCRIIEALSP